jgi:hypothetical protein
MKIRISGPAVRILLFGFCFVLLLWPMPVARTANGLSLEVDGDAARGYTVKLLLEGRPAALQAGEFSAQFQNGSRELHVSLENWRATSWTGDDQHVILSGDANLDALKTILSIRVEYVVINPHVVRKIIRLHQSDAYLLLYQVSNRIEPPPGQAKFWSFDQVDCKGGPLHEYFPAAGFRTGDNVSVGLLTDSGYRNQWNRIIRRDNGEFAKPAPNEISDVNLDYVCRREERARGQSYVSQTFGEELVRDPLSGKPVALPPSSTWHRNGATLTGTSQQFGLRSNGRDDGVIIPVQLSGGNVYELSFQYRSARAFAARFLDTGTSFRTLKNLTLYNDQVPKSGSIWSKFSSTVYIPALQGNSALFFGNSGDFAENAPADIQVKDLKLAQVAAHFQPYHRLEMDRDAEKTSFIFADQDIPDTLRGHRLASELYLSDGLGFQGSDPEKVIYADTMMLAWTAEPHVFRPILVPSIFYGAAGEMYMRDSFYAAAGLNNRELNESLLALWGENQGKDGVIGTLVNADRGHIERKSNDSTPLWFIWALKNHQRFGAEVPMGKLRLSANYAIHTYDPQRTGICRAEFIIGQNDVIEFPRGTSDIAVNQGMWAVTLRVIRELAIPGISDQISDGWIQHAEDAYRSYYNPGLKRILPEKNVTDAIGFDEIFPEFLSLWLFNRKLLTDEMVQNHLDQIPAMLPRKDAPHPQMGTVRPILIGLRDDHWQYESANWHPMVGDEHASRYSDHRMDGTYYNGGSWMRIEICGYVTGKLHGWSKANDAIENRLWAEINTDPDFPTSQEYLATDPDNSSFGAHRVFAWNSFVLQALQMARSRQPNPEM